MLVPEKEYNALQKKAALKTPSDKLLTIDEARAFSKKMVRKWAAGR